MISLISKSDQKHFFQLKPDSDRVLYPESGFLIPNICLKEVNSVVKGDPRAFEVPLSYIGPIYNPCNPKAAKSKLKSFLLDAYHHSIYHKKRIRRVPSCSRKRSTKN